MGILKNAHFLDKSELKIEIMLVGSLLSFIG